MKAMVLAAGLGTRLRPLTDSRPKALVEVAGRTMLELTLERLRHFGIRDVIVNVHHYADMVVEYLKQHENFGLHIEISREEVPLDTGGGVKQASWFLDETFLVHNVDVVSNIDLHRMAQYHSHQNAIATLAVQDRPTSRYLLFDDQLQLCGRRSAPDMAPEMVRASVSVQALAFAGIHVMSPRLLTLLAEEGPFPIIPAYLRLAAQQERITGFRSDEYYWRDLGRPHSIEAAARELQENGLGRVGPT